MSYDVSFVGIEHMNLGLLEALCPNSLASSHSRQDMAGLGLNLESVIHLVPCL